MLVIISVTTRNYYHKEILMLITGVRVPPINSSSNTLFLAIKMFATSIFVLTIITSCWCLTSVQVFIPSTARTGDSPILRCVYDPENNNQLYTVEWYKDEKSFYKFAPGDNPPKTFSTIPGLQVLQADFNNTVSRLVFKNVNVGNSGTYRCEVSSGAPLFKTMSESGVLQVVEVPKNDPLINGLKDKYNEGDVLKAECISHGSSPAVTLSWMLNGNDAEPGMIKSQHSKPNGTLLDTYSALELQITAKLYAEGPLTILCTANLNDIFYKTSEKCVDLGDKKCGQEVTTTTTTMATTTTTTKKPTNGGGTMSFALWTLLLVGLLLCAH